MKYVTFVKNREWCEGMVLAEVDWGGVPMLVIRYYRNPSADPFRRPYVLVPTSECKECPPSIGYVAEDF